MARRTFRFASAVALVLVGVVAPAARAVPAPSTAPLDQRYYWRWSDGSEERHRTFRQSVYRVPERLPTLVVSAYPASPTRSVVLQYRQDGRWRTEDSGRTNASGQVRLALNPYCPDGSWCDGTVDYRAVAGGQTATLHITYAP